MTGDNVESRPDDSDNSDDEDPSNGESEAGQEAGSATPPAPDGRKRPRGRKLAHYVDDDEELSGEAELMVEDSSFLHRVFFRSSRFTSQGGPAREALGLADLAARVLEAIFPGVDPYMRTLAPTGSFEVEFFPPEREKREARGRQEQLGDDAGAAALPDTSLALLVMADALSQQDSDDAAWAIRRISQKAASEVKALSLTLGESGTEFDLGEVRSGALVTPGHALRVVERLDAAEELKPLRVNVFGVLQGLSSAGSGSFELVTDRDTPLPPGLGRRSPGDKIKGELSPAARRTARAEGLWDRHVKARLSVTRRRSGSSIRQAGVRMTSVEARFEKDGDSR